MSSTGASPRRGFIAATLGTSVALLVQRLLGAAGNQTATRPTAPNPPRAARRIVTGVDGQGRSRIEIDQPLAIDASDNQRHRSDFWLVRHLPVPLNGPLEP